MDLRQSWQREDIEGKVRVIPAPVDVAQELMSVPIEVVG